MRRVIKKAAGKDKKMKERAGKWDMDREGGDRFKIEEIEKRVYASKRTRTSKSGGRELGRGVKACVGSSSFCMNLPLGDPVPNGHALRFGFLRIQLGGPHQDRCGVGGILGGATVSMRDK